MKFVKTVNKWECGGERVTSLGRLVFNANGICAIDNDELAEKVVGLSPSLVFADEDEDAVEALVAELKAKDIENNKPKDDDAIKSFLQTEGNGMVVTSSQVESQNTIGNPANESDNGSFAPTAEAAALTPNAPIIGTPSNDDNVGLVDASGNSISKGKEGTSNADQIKDLLGEFSHKDIWEMIEASGVDLSKEYSHKETKSKNGLIKIAIDRKLEI